jgi:lysophospholipid acyltransferase (LPLAT)-like uncharacterized protein
MGETKIRAEDPQQQSDAHVRSLVGRIGLRIFGLLSGVLLRLLGATWRIEVLGDDPRQSSSSSDPAKATGTTHLAALFHESMLPCAWFFRDRRYSVAVSQSRDGDLIRTTLLSLGYREPARGSSSRGGSGALRGLVRQFADGITISVLVDGPRGPARVAKPGIISLGRMVEAPIQPVAFSARPALRLASWDRSLIPLPFARVVCAFGRPIASAAEGDEAQEQIAARQLDQELIALHREADRAVGPR